MTNAPTPAGMSVSEIAAIIRKHALSRSNEAPTPRESVTAAQAVVDYLAAHSSAGAEPVGHFQFNDGWNAWEQVVEDESGKEGVVALYARPAPVQPDSGGVVADDPIRSFVKRVMVWRLSDYDKSTPQGAMGLTLHRVDEFAKELRAILAALSPVAAEGGEKLREAAIVAKDMADNAVYNLNRAGLTRATATCERAFQCIYSTLNDALRTEPTGGGEGT